ncbi:uncharacterized protein LOC144470821 [Augochlora pura]
MQSNLGETKNKNVNVVIKSTENKNVNAVIKSTKDAGGEVHNNDQDILYDNVTKLCDGKFQCEICKCPLPSHDHILPHVKGKQHVAANAALKQSKKQQSDLKLSEIPTCLEKSKQLSTCDTIFCIVCNRKMDSMHNYLQHIEGKSHINLATINAAINLKDNADKNNVENSGRNVNTNLKPIITNLEKQINDNDEEWTINKNVNAVNKSTKDAGGEVHNNDQDILYDNVTKLCDGKFQCEICECPLPSHDHILPHVKGKQHVAAIAALKQSKKQQSDLKRSEIPICSEKSEQLSTCDTIFCVVCNRKMDSMHNYLQHIEGKSHINLATMNPGINLKDNADINNVENSGRNVNTNLKPIINNIGKEMNDKDEEWTISKLCSHIINENNVLEHITTETYKNTYFYNYAKDDIILYKCICCNLIIQENSSIVSHLSQENHLLYLRNTSKRMITENINATDGIKNIFNTNYLPLLNILFLKKESTFAPVTEKCFLCFNSLNISFLSNIRTNIDYQCSICSIKISGIKNLIQHYKSNMHLSKVKLVLSDQEDKNYTDIKISPLIDSFNKISITDNKSQSSNACDKDLNVPKNVYKQLMLDIISPCMMNNDNNKAKSKENKLSERLNKLYQLEYLELEQKMYTLTEEKINDIKFYSKFIVQNDTDNYFCIACKTKVSNELYLLYEHTCLLTHKANTTEIQNDDNNKGLIEQYMRLIAEKTAKCYVCDINMLNNFNSISTHIKSKKHKLNYKNCCIRINTNIDSILKNFSNLYYSIQRFSCVTCQKNTRYKVEFMEHIVEKHKDLNKYKFDFCIPCATLWLSDSNSYEGHCSDIIHKYLLKSKDFMIEELPKCIQDLLTQVDKTVKILLDQTKISTKNNVQEKVRKSLETKAKTFSPMARAYLFGSQLIGIGFANSDIDIYIDFDNKYYGKNDNVLGELLHIEKAVCEDDDWEVKEILIDCRVPIIKLIYIPENLDCDVSFLDGLSVEKSKLLRSYYDACSPCKKVTLFIKKWFSFFNLPEGHGLINYGLYWLIIFYLQICSHLPSVADLIKENNNPQFVGDWKIGFALPNCKGVHRCTITGLLRGFFEYYANFDYQNYIICPLMGFPIAKKNFSLLLLPIEMQPYIVHLRTSCKPEFLRIDSPFCVQDPLLLSHNITRGVGSITLKYFKQYCQDSAAILKSIV